MRASHLISHLQQEIQTMASSPSKPYRIRALRKVIELLRPFDTITERTLRDLPLTEYMRTKLIALKGQPPPAPHPKESLKEKLMEVIGIGAKAAQQLIDAGVTSTADLRRPKFFAMLSQAAQVLVRHRPCRAIPRTTIHSLEPLLRVARFDVTLVGSYRREKSFSRDVDVMVVGSPRRFAAYLRTLARTLPHAHFYSEGDDRASFVCTPGLTIKIDVFRVDKQYKYGMLLYSTGSKEFNIRMRARAKRSGYLLNQHGLWCDGKLVPVASERDFFTVLGWDYVPPRLRKS